MQSLGYDLIVDDDGIIQGSGKIVEKQRNGRSKDGLVQRMEYNEEVNKLGDDLKELYGNVGEILGRIRDGTLEADIYGAESIKAEAVTEKWSDLGW